MWGEPFPVAAALDDDLVAGNWPAVQSAVPKDGVLEESQPFVHGAVAGDHEAGGPVPVEDQVVQIGRLLGGEAGAGPSSRMSRSGARKDRKVRSRELSTLVGHGLEVIVG